MSTGTHIAAHAAKSHKQHKHVLRHENTRRDDQGAIAADQNSINKSDSAQRDLLAEAKLGRQNENEELLGECQLDCSPLAEEGFLGRIVDAEPRRREGVNDRSSPWHHEPPLQCIGTHEPPGPAREEDCSE